MLGVAIPLILHLIKRERARRIEFPTLMFLRRVSKKTIRYQKFRDLLLLLLRVLALALIALAFTRPYRDLPAASAAAARAGTTHVLLLDNSLSMSYSGRWARAREAAAAIINQVSGDDRIALLEFSDRTLVRMPPARDKALLKEEIEKRIEPTDRSTRYIPALKAAEKTALDSGAGRRVIHLISDFQKNGWQAGEEELSLAPGSEIDPVNVGSKEFSNLAIGDVQITEVAEGSEGGMKVRFSVINFGNEDRKGSKVTLSLDGRGIMERRADIPRGEILPLEFLLPGLSGGIHQLVIEVDDPRLTADNRFATTLVARGKTQVISVEDPARSPGRAPAFFLSRALNVSSASAYQLTSMPLSRLESGPLAPGSLLVWNNASGGSSALQKKLQEYISNGGGLVVVVADDERASDFNRSFGSWLPVKVDPAAGDAAARNARRGEDYSLLTNLSMDHPVFRPFSEPHSGNFSSARFFRHATISTSAEVLARFDNGDPALVSIARDKGRILIFASSADDSANNLPLKPVYAPFWIQMLHYLDNVGEERRYSLVGETISPRKMLLEAGLRAGHQVNEFNQAFVALDPLRNRVTLSPGSDVLQVDHAGFYEIRSPGLSVPVAVNPLPRESDLTPGDAEEMLAAWISKNDRIAPVTADEEKVSPEEQDRRQHIWRYLLLSGLLFFLGEFFLSSQAVLKAEN